MAVPQLWLEGPSGLLLLPDVIPRSEPVGEKGFLFSSQQMKITLSHSMEHSVTNTAKNNSYKCLSVKGLFTLRVGPKMIFMAKKNICQVRWERLCSPAHLASHRVNGKRQGFEMSCG